MWNNTKINDGVHNTGSGEDAEQQSSGTECRIGEQVEEANEKKGEDVLHVIQMSSKKKKRKTKTAYYNHCILG